MCNRADHSEAILCSTTFGDDPQHVCSKDQDYLFDFHQLPLLFAGGIRCRYGRSLFYVTHNHLGKTWPGDRRNQQRCSKPRAERAKNAAVECGFYANSCYIIWAFFLVLRQVWWLPLNCTGTCETWLFLSWIKMTKDHSASPGHSSIVHNPGKISGATCIARVVPHQRTIKIQGLKLPTIWMVMKRRLAILSGSGLASRTSMMWGCLQTGYPNGLSSCFPTEIVVLGLVICTVFWHTQFIWLAYIHIYSINHHDMFL